MLDRRLTWWLVVGIASGCGRFGFTSHAIDAAVPDADIDGSVADSAVADVAVPDGGVTDVAVPDGDVPDTDVPDADVPDGDVPDADVPDADVPDGSAPDADIPDADIPDADIPDADIPDADIPDADIPDAADPHKVVFVTSERFDGNMGGLAGADAACQRLADAAGLTGTFLAWLGDGTDGPRTRFVRASDPYRLVDGTQVADDFADLIDLTVDHPIDLTELGGPAPRSLGLPGCGSDYLVYTGTSNFGQPAGGHCMQWTSTTADFASFGSANDPDSTFGACEVAGPMSMACATLAPIFCFEQ